MRQSEPAGAIAERTCAFHVGKLIINNDCLADLAPLAVLKHWPAQAMRPDALLVLYLHQIRSLLLRRRLFFIRILSWLHFILCRY